jgi:hypothetical protein
VWRSCCWAFSRGTRLQYVTIILSSINDPRTSSSTSRLRHPAGLRASSPRRMTSTSPMTLCSMRMQYLPCCSFILLAAADVDSDGTSYPMRTLRAGLVKRALAQTPSLRLHLGELVGETEMGNTQSKTDAGTIGQTYIFSVL